MDQRTKSRILNKLDKLGEAKSSELMTGLNISRQMVARHLRDLVQAGNIEKSGSTRSATYRVAAKV